MPLALPWKKKSKINRDISKFVNDIRASKRGESLVVQTGFPTSLIDLIVKNRNRFNNKHRSYIESSQIPHQCPAPPPFINTTEDEHFIFDSNSKLDDTDADADAEKKIKSSELERCDSGKKICVLNHVTYEENEDRDGNVNQGSAKKNMVCMVVITVALISAVATKKIAMVITFVAFLLMFLEKLLNSCVNRYRRWMVSRKLGKMEKLRSIEESKVVTKFTDFREEFNGMIRGSLGRKIDVNDTLANDEIDRERIFSNLDREMKVSEESELPFLGRKESAKLKAKKFRKYVARKLSGESRKKRRNKQGTPEQCVAPLTDSNTNTEESISCGGTDEEDNAEEEYTDRDGSMDVSNFCLDNEVDVCSEGTRNWSWSTFIPIMIVLVGLVGGRTMALVLSIVCILLHKLYGGT